MKPLQIRVLRSAYVVGKKQMRTVGAVEAELIRLGSKDVRVVPDADVSYRKVAAALRMLQKHGVSIGMVGNAHERK